MKVFLLLFLASCAVASEDIIEDVIYISSKPSDKAFAVARIEKGKIVDLSEDSSRSALAPPPIDDMKITMSYSKKTGESKITEPTPLQKWLQDEFTALGWWNFIFLGSLFWLGAYFAWKGDTFGVLCVLATFATTFGLMVYAFYER